jgi:hypothetical protein
MNAPAPAIVIRLFGLQDRGWTMVDNTLDLTTAAGVLGLSVATLRKRLQRGTVAGFKAADGTWRVVLDKVDSRVDRITPR